VFVTSYGRVTQPVVAVVGLWDPLLADHRDLFQQLCAHARERALAASVVVIDPDPVKLLHGAAQVPVYDDLATRLELLRACRLDAILRLRFAKKDLVAGAAEFFTALQGPVQLQELWLGARQTLGSGASGSFQTILDCAAQHHTQITRLPDVALKAAGRTIRGLLLSGRVAEARALVGRPPGRRRPRGARLRFAWPAGTYQVAPLSAPTAPLAGPPFTLQLEPDAAGLCRATWPDRRIKYLVFLSGPGDAPGAN